MILWICRILRLLLSMLMSISMSMYYLLCKLRFVLLYDLYALSLSLVIFGFKSPIRKKLKEIPNISFFPRKMFQNRIWSYSPLMLSLAHHCWRSFWSRPSNCFHKLWQLSKSDLENTSTKTIFVPGQYVFSSIIKTTTFRILLSTTINGLIVFFSDLSRALFCLFSHSLTVWH